MRVIGLAGWSGAGKTTLLAAAHPGSTARPHGLDRQARASRLRDRPAGQGSFEHRAAGASEVLVASERRWALMHELRAEPEPGLAELLAPALARRPRHRRGLQGRRASEDRGASRRQRQAPAPDFPEIRAIASDIPLPHAPVPIVGLDDRPRDLSSGSPPVDEVMARLRSAALERDCWRPRSRRSGHDGAASRRSMLSSRSIASCFSATTSSGSRRWSGRTRWQPSASP